MQLLYLWIENYKNIQNQGFNFSPLHRFHFEPRTENNQIVGGTLTDKMPKEEHDTNKALYSNFFGQDFTSVTAIVGKNGSGKSNIGELIERALYASDTKIGKMLLVFKQNEDLCYFSSYNDDEIIAKNFDLKNLFFHHWKLNYLPRPSCMNSLLWMRYNSNFLTKPYGIFGHPIQQPNILHVSPAIWFNSKQADMEGLRNLIDRTLVNFVKFTKENNLSTLFKLPLDVKVSVLTNVKIIEESFDKINVEKIDDVKIIEEKIIELYKNQFHRKRSSISYEEESGHFYDKFILDFLPTENQSIAYFCMY